MDFFDHAFVWGQGFGLSSLEVYVGLLEVELFWFFAGFWLIWRTILIHRGFGERLFPTLTLNTFFPSDQIYDRLVDQNFFINGFSPQFRILKEHNLFFHLSLISDHFHLKKLPLNIRIHHGLVQISSLSGFLPRLLTTPLHHPLKCLFSLPHLFYRLLPSFLHIQPLVVVLELFSITFKRVPHHQFHHLFLFPLLIFDELLLKVFNVIVKVFVGVDHVGNFFPYCFFVCEGF